MAGLQRPACYGVSMGGGGDLRQQAAAGCAMGVRCTAEVMKTRVCICSQLLPSSSLLQLFHACGAPDLTLRVYSPLPEDWRRPHRLGRKRQHGGLQLPPRPFQTPI